MPDATRLWLLVASVPLMVGFSWWQARPLVIDGGVPSTFKILLRILLQLVLLGLMFLQMVLLLPASRANLRGPEMIGFLLLAWGPPFAVMMYRRSLNPSAYIWYKQ